MKKKKIAQSFTMCTCAWKAHQFHRQNHKISPVTARQIEQTKNIYHDYEKSNSCNPSDGASVITGK